MRKLQNDKFYFQAGKRAVYLLHGFTGSTADVRILGRFLEKKGYTCYATQYKGHGVEPEQLIESHPKQWWQDVIDGYHFLIENGYEEIAVIGLSLGGVMTLKLAADHKVKGIVTMCAPMTMRTTDVMFEGVVQFATQYKKQEGKTAFEIAEEIAAIRSQGMPSLPALQQLVLDTRAEVDMIYAPILVVQATNDRVIDPQSAQFIYDEIQSTTKYLNWYDESGHVITLDKEKDQLHEDIFRFLEQLDWTV